MAHSDDSGNQLRNQSAAKRKAALRSSQNIPSMWNFIDDWAREGLFLNEQLEHSKSETVQKRER